jgi:hypothetical protein
VAVQFPEPVLMTRFLAQREVVVPEPPEMTFGTEHLIVSFGNVHVPSIPQVVRAFSITRRRAEVPATPQSAGPGRSRIPNARPR